MDKHSTLHNPPANVTPLFSERELDWHARLIAERDELAKSDRRADTRDTRDRIVADNIADVEDASLGAAIILAFIVGMFAGAMLLASAAFAIDTIRGWLL